MSTAAIYIDESGTFSEYESRDPYYIVTLVFHDEANDISTQIGNLNANLSEFALPNKAVHTGPIIRREFEYRNLDITERKRIFNLLFYFARRTPFCYKTIVVEKKHLDDPLDIYARLAKRLAAFLSENMGRLLAYDHIVVNYDNGQSELTKIIVAVFSATVGDIEYRKVTPSDCKLFQVADLICTLCFLFMKYESKTLSRSEQNFFSSRKDLKKSYLSLLNDKAFPANL
ncbi:MAG: DUF3800 domain-containing protein [Clostridiales Family XIII bacterium]|jgi:hypothetical protein|nr:DUF3800 domain-containing protein [Clostridiales Family XIII bacterium]